MGALRNAVRREEAGSELERLTGDLALWVAHRRARDAEQQYATQLAALEATLSAGLAVVRDALDAVDPTGRTGTVYARCRAVEEQVVFLRRYLEHFRSKWDQRDTTDEESRLTLLAAEELIWSCWAPVFRALRLPPMPAPLPYFEPEYDPRAHPRTDPPRALRADARLAAAVGALPLPLIALPPVCRARPWWLVHVAHETGHHVQYDAAQGALLAAFRALVERAANAAGADASRWAGWQVELFADAFAALSAGAAAGWALGEQALGEDADNATARPGYPSLLARQALMAAVAEEAPAPAADADLAAAGAVAEAIATDPLVGDVSLAGLCELPASRLRAEAERWQRRLLGAPEPAAEATLIAARVTVAGAVGAWRQVAQEPDGVRRAEQRDRLARRARQVLALSHPRGRRAAPAAAAPALGDAEAALRSALGDLAA